MLTSMLQTRPQQAHLLACAPSKPRGPAGRGHGKAQSARGGLESRAGLSAESRDQGEHGARRKYLVHQALCWNLLVTYEMSLVVRCTSKAEDCTMEGLKPGTCASAEPKCRAREGRIALSRCPLVAQEVCRVHGLLLKPEQSCLFALLCMRKLLRAAILCQTAPPPPLFAWICSE